jgi:hypothetical protein
VDRPRHRVRALNCAVSCPCQFNALPTHGHCRAHSFFQIERGRFGSTPLDGLRWSFLGSFPGPIHHGNGTWLIVIDERADAKQREALEAIATGRETEPGTLITQVFSTLITTLLPPHYKPIDLTIDVAGAKATLRVPGLIEAEGHPIANKATNAWSSTARTLRSTRASIHRDRSQSLRSHSAKRSIVWSRSQRRAASVGTTNRILSKNPAIDCPSKSSSG